MGGWLTVAALLAVLTPLAGVPLTAILFYLRGLREQYAGRAAHLLTRVDRLEGLTDTLIQRITDMERNCATREEWIRESMLARRERRRLIEGVVRLQTRVHEANGGGLVARGRPRRPWPRPSGWNEPATRSPGRPPIRRSFPRNDPDG